MKRTCGWRAGVALCALALAVAGVAVNADAENHEVRGVCFFFYEFYRAPDTFQGRIGSIWSGVSQRLTCVYVYVGTCL